MVYIIVFVVIIITIKLVAITIEQKSLYFPKKGIVETPDAIQVGFQDVWLKTEDHQTLHAWYVPVAKSKQVVLFCHGNAGNLSGRLDRVAFFKKIGVNLLIFDYRGYGQSTGTPSEKGLYRDVQTAYHYLINEKKMTSSQILVYGKSLGCAVGIDLALHQPVGALILESPFASVKKVVKEMYFLEPITWLTSQKYDSESKIRHITVPKLVIHGRYDDMIRFEHASALHQAAAPPKQLLPYDGGHNDMDYVTSQTHGEKVKEILKSLKNKPSAKKI